jgi:hypothetical protein
MMMSRYWCVEAMSSLSIRVIIPTGRKKQLMLIHAEDMPRKIYLVIKEKDSSVWTNGVDTV